MKTDTFGRAYAYYPSLKAGDKVQVDGGFTCIPAGAVREVFSDDDGDLYIKCCGSEAECMADLLVEPTEYHGIDYSNGYCVGIYPDIVEDHGFVQDQYNFEETKNND